MATGNINIGFMENNRCSSRILKPPGGGYSDIFGTDEVKQVAPKAKEHNASRSVMQDILSTQNVSSVTITTSKVEETKTVTSVDETDTSDKKITNGKEENGHTEESNGTTEITEEVEKLNVSNGESESKETNGEEAPKQNGSQRKDSIKDIINETTNDSAAKTPSKNVVEENIKAEINTPTRPTRSRVPPGGFSSGLW